MNSARREAHQIKKTKPPSKTRKYVMKNLVNILRNIGRPILLAAAGLALLASASEAASIKLETQVPGYTQRGNGWVLVLPELRPVLGGAVRWDNARGCYVTDRIPRNDKIRITISPTTATERCQRLGLAGAESDTGLYGWSFVRLPFVVTGKVPIDPRQDNVWVWVYTSSGFYEKRIPIGTR